MKMNTGKRAILSSFLQSAVRVAKFARRSKSEAFNDEPQSRNSDKIGRDDAAIIKVIVLIHGIRTHAPWQDELGRLFEQECPGSTAIILRYDYYNLFKFWSPVGRWRQDTIAFVREKLREVRGTFPEAEICVLAHSFGTHALVEALRDDPSIKIDRMVLCASVVDTGFQFGGIARNFPEPQQDLRQRIVSDRGILDIFPKLAQITTWGFGASGTYGFRDTIHLTERPHRRSHSAYLDLAFAKTYWVPFFCNGEIIEGDAVGRSPPAWMSILNILNKYLVGVLLAMSLAIWAFPNSFYAKAVLRAITPILAPLQIMPCSYIGGNWRDIHGEESGLVDRMQIRQALCLLDFEISRKEGPITLSGYSSRRDDWDRLTGSANIDGCKFSVGAKLQVDNKFQVWLCVYPAESLCGQNAIELHSELANAVCQEAAISSGGRSSRTSDWIKN